MRKVVSKMLLEDKDSSQWPAYRDELMGKYKGKDIFDAYAQQVSKVQGKTYTFK
jgi:putative aldouronate transport system substrate-binding protein